MSFLILTSSSFALDAQSEISDSLLVSFEHNMDSIVNEAIDSMAFPGAQILISKKGEILFEKQCGFHTYDKKRPVRQDDL